PQQGQEQLQGGAAGLRDAANPHRDRPLRRGIIDNNTKKRLRPLFCFTGVFARGLSAPGFAARTPRVCGLRGTYGSSVPRDCVGKARSAAVTTFAMASL